MGPDIGGERIGGRATGFSRRLAGGDEARTAELDAAALGSREGSLGALADRFTFVLRDGGQDVDGELVGVRVIDGDELDAAVHQRGDEGEVAGQPVELGDDELGLVLAAGGQCLGQFGAVCAFAALHPDVIAPKVCCVGRATQKSYRLPSIGST